MNERYGMLIVMALNAASQLSTTISSPSPKRTWWFSMPEFATPFAGMASDRKLTKQELVRAIRYVIAAEYEAIQLYTQLAESTDDECARAVLIDIADEEVVHAGEFLRLLKELEPREEELYKEGYEEVEEILEKLRK